MQTAIIIVAYNARKYLADCLESLFQAIGREDKVVVVDNASFDDTKEYLKNNFSQVYLIESKKNLGFAGGNNLGIAWAMQKGFKYIYLLNQDTIVDRGFLKEAVKIMEKEKAGAVQSRLMLWPEKNKVNSLGNSLHYLGFGFSSGGYKNLEKKEKDILEINGYFSGAGVLLSLQVLRETGLFEDEYFMYHEDLDLGWRMRLRGYSLFLAFNSLVYHKYEFSRSIKKYYWMERNRFITLFSHYKIFTLFLIFPALIIMEMGLFLFSFKSGFWKEKIKVYKYLLTYQGWKFIFRKRKQSFSLRRIKDREIVKGFVGKIEFQEINNWLLDKIANPLFNFYWQIVKRLIFW